MNWQTAPSEIASVVRSCPTVTATTAAGDSTSPATGARDGAQQREGLEVDADELDVRLAEGSDVAVDRLAVGGDEQDAPVLDAACSSTSLANTR